MSTCGHSNDHYQDILRQDPSHILLILQLCNLIAIGTLTDGPARTLLLSGKGTALVKNITDVRPIVTVHPLLHYTGHAIATEYSSRIRTICGPEQFMGLPAGCEIVAHYIRTQLESNPSLVIAKVDVKNALSQNIYLRCFRLRICFSLSLRCRWFSMTPEADILVYTKWRRVSHKVEARVAHCLTWVSLPPFEEQLNCILQFLFSSLLMILMFLVRQKKSSLQ